MKLTVNFKGYTYTLHVIHYENSLTFNSFSWVSANKYTKVKEILTAREINIRNNYFFS